jgi:hypothetical protein
MSPEGHLTENPEVFCQPAKSLSPASAQHQEADGRIRKSPQRLDDRLKSFARELVTGEEEKKIILEDPELFACFIPARPAEIRLKCGQVNSVRNDNDIIVRDAVVLVELTLDPLRARHDNSILALGVVLSFEIQPDPIGDTEIHFLANLPWLETRGLHPGPVAALGGDYVATDDAAEGVCQIASAPLDCLPASSGKVGEPQGVQRKTMRNRLKYDVWMVSLGVRTAKKIDHVSRPGSSQRPLRGDPFDPPVPAMLYMCNTNPHRSPQRNMNLIAHELSHGNGTPPIA